MTKKQGKESNSEVELNKAGDESQSKSSTPKTLWIAKYLPREMAVKELAMKMDAATREYMHLETNIGNDDDQQQERNQNDFYPDTPSTSRAATDEQPTYISTESEGAESMEVDPGQTTQEEEPDFSILYDENYDKTNDDQKGESEMQKIRLRDIKREIG